MSTYNSKFSGAEIDALLEKVASGQVGGASVSEKETLAKEVGATHKHTITLAANMPDNIVMKIRCVTYTADSTPLTVDTMTSLMMQGEGTYFNGYYAGSQNGIAGVSDVIWCLATGEDDSVTLVVSPGRGITDHNYVESIDFTNQTAVTKSLATFEAASGFPVQILIDNLGATFTDDVTEL
jgi:hypothetical protein